MFNSKQTINNIPMSMQRLDNWCAYRTKFNPEKKRLDKFILNCKTGKWAKANDSTTWSSFKDAIKYAQNNYCKGIAFALNNNGISCIDIDHCINEKGVLCDIAKELIQGCCSTYIERSTSGNGIHIFVQDDILQGNKYKNKALLNDCDLEVYNTSRFISMTGNMFVGIHDLQPLSTEMKMRIRQLLGKKQTYENSKPIQLTISMKTDADVIETIKRSKRGEEFERLFNGLPITGDHSIDDYRLINILAFFTNCSSSQVERIFKSSGQYRPEKGQAYLDLTINKVISHLTTRKY